MKMTIRELSDKTGFSPSTISRVLTQNKNVNSATRQKVEEALRQFDCLPAPSTRKKASKKTVLVVSGETSTNFHTKLFETMSRKLRREGYVVLLGNSGFDEKLEEQYVEYAQSQRYSGIIMLTPVETPALKRLAEKSPCPIILVSRFLRSIDLDSVYMDNYRAGYITANHLLDMGHHRVACLTGGRKSTSSADRLNGFIDAMADAGLPEADHLVWEGDLRKESGVRFGEEYVKSHRDRTAVFCISEPMARGFVETVLAAGLDIPGDVSVICVAQTPAVVKDNVKLTCVIHNAQQMGDTAVDMLLDRLDGLDAAPRKIIYPPQLCVQDSVRDLKR